MRKKINLLALISGLCLSLLGYVTIQRSARASFDKPSNSMSEHNSANKQITIHAAKRGSPNINLGDGQSLRSIYEGAPELAQILASNDARALSMTTADFDEDGMPDLVCGYGNTNGGIITLQRGNVDAVYPNEPEAKQRVAQGTATDQPFLLQTKTFVSPGSPSFLGAGDFDADGHWDLVAAQKGADALYFLRGDGRGGFGAAQRMELGGNVTALSTGEMNRADGLTDLAVSIVGPDGAQALVFEGPEGALKRLPERFALPAAASSVALGQLDSEYPFDLAVAAGSNLLIVHGRDRRLSVDDPTRARVATAVVDQQTFPFIIASMAVGDFVPRHEYREDIALLAEDGRISLLKCEEQTGRTVWCVHEEIEATPGDGAPRVAGALANQLIRVNTSDLPGD